MKNLKNRYLTFFKNWKSFFVIITILTATFFSSQNICAEVWLSDNFNVTSGGGDLNYGIDSSRQSGSMSPYYYTMYQEFPTVTNVGPYAGKCNMATLAIGSWASIPEAFDSHSYTIEYELDHYSGGPDDWFGLDIGKDAPYFPYEGVGMGLEFFSDGSYKFFSYTNVIANSTAGTLTYPVKIKVCVKQNSVGDDALVSMFVNGNAFPIETPFNNAVHIYPNGFTNNVTTWGPIAPAQATIDNFRLASAENTVAQISSWSGDADSGISSTKFYTHAINLNLENNVTINDVSFDGVGTATSGENWMLRTAPGFSFNNTFMNDLGIDVNLSGNSFSLGTGAVYALTHCSTLTLTNLNPRSGYRLTLFGCGYDANSKVYLTALDGGGKSAQIGMAENGIGNGQKITYDYMADEDGVFSIAASTIPGASTNEWYWFAFSNEILVPETPTGLTASEGEYTNKVSLEWSEVTGAEYYSVFRNTINSSGSATDISGQILLNSYDDTSAAFAQHYYYWVQACSTAGCSALSTATFGFTKSEFPPEKPLNISPLNFNTITSPVTFVASSYSDTGSFAFAASQWQVSQNAGFFSIKWNSDETIPVDTINPPTSKIPEGTNFWRVRYKNDRNTWSDYSAGTSFIFVKNETASGVFWDTFNVSGSGDVNHGYDNAGRQYGSATPLTYTIANQTEVGNASTNPGELLLGLNSAIAPNYSFTQSGEFIIEYDAEQHNLDGGTDWISLNFGKNDNSELFPIGLSGAGLVFFANGNFQAFDSTNLVGGGTGGPVGEKIHITLVASTEDFDYSSVKYAAFVNGIPMLANSAESGYIYNDNNGFDQNYISIFSYNNTSPNKSLIDNLKVSKAPTNEVRVNRWISDATSLIDPLKDYTHAVNFNGDPVEINGVQFEGTGFNPGSYLNGSPMIKTNNWEFMGSNGSIVFSSDDRTSNIVTDTTTKTLMKNVGYSGNAFAIKLSELTPYSSNTLSIYSYGWEGKNAGRFAYFTGLSGGKITKIDQDEYEQGVGIIIQYDYVASGDGTFTFIASPADTTAPFLTSGFTSEFTAMPEPIFIWIIVLIIPLIKFRKS